MRTTIDRKHHSLTRFNTPQLYICPQKTVQSLWISTEMKRSEFVKHVRKQKNENTWNICETTWKDRNECKHYEPLPNETFVTFLLSTNEKKRSEVVWSHHCRFICTSVIIIIYFLHKINCNINSWCLDLRSHSQSKVKAAVSNWWREAGAAGEGGATRGSSWREMSAAPYPFSDNSVPSFSRCPKEKKNAWSSSWHDPTQWVNEVKVMTHHLPVNHNVYLQLCSDRAGILLFKK